MKKTFTALALVGSAALVLAGCSSNSAGPAAATGFEPEAAKGQNITLWLMGNDTPDELRTYLKDQYAKATGGTLTIEEQTWGDALTKLTNQLPDAKNTPDVPQPRHGRCGRHCARR